MRYLLLFLCLVACGLSYFFGKDAGIHQGAGYFAETEYWQGVRDAFDATDQYFTEDNYARLINNHDRSMAEYLGKGEYAIVVKGKSSCVK